jgi:hypothetical protein
MGCLSYMEYLASVLVVESPYIAQGTHPSAAIASDSPPLTGTGRGGFEALL